VTHAVPEGPRLLDLTLPSPAENLALDEALLLEAEERLARGEAPASCETLRLWESSVPFVVLGVASRLAEDVDEDACAREGVPILRRASGGGTVLQGPGCLNFALVLSLEARGELRDVTRSYMAILDTIAAALGPGEIVRQGTSDLAAAGKKLSGNAQKRTRRALLHHGTILHVSDLGRIARLLREPQRQPAYRAGRPHGDFLWNLPLPLAAIKARLAAAWKAAPRSPSPLPDLEPLLAGRHLDPGWVRRW